MSLVGRADGALSCYPLTLDQARQLPGWSKIEQYAKDNYGEGGGPHTNPGEYPDRGANACLNQSRIPVQFTAKPTCTATKTEIEGKVDGTTQKTTFQEAVGDEQNASWTVTKASSLTSGAKFSVSIGIPEFGDIGAETSVETTFTDERSTSFSTTSSTMRTTTLDFENKSGDTCKMTLETQKCTGTASGRVPVMASGRVWFFYHSKRAATNDPNGGEHYHYNVEIDSVLTEEERTLYVEFQGPVNSVSKSGYSTNCQQTK